MGNTKIQSHSILNNEISSKPELRNLKVLFFLSAFLIITDYLMPQYFGVHIGYDMTCTRFANVFILFYFFLNRKVLTMFVDCTLKCKLFVPSMLFLIVASYTMVIRTDPGTFISVFLELLTLFMLVFLIRYVIGVKTAIIWSIRCTYFLVIEGVVEFLYGKSIYHKLLSTMPNPVVDGYRSGHYRIMGPCGHSLGYGLLLLMLIALACIDIERDKLYIFQRPFLLMGLIINVFLTGSRSTTGIMFLEIALLFIFGTNKSKKKTIFVSIFMILGLGAFLSVFHNTGIGRYILMQLASVVDQILGTTYAGLFGADVTALQNSENYRKVLPKIFGLDWLNPLVGRGTGASFGVKIDGIFVYSVDNYYVCLYIRYAYPGLVTYVFFVIVNALIFIYNAIKRQSGVIIAILIAFSCYFFNLWWLDTLQTLKYLYIQIAIAIAYIMLMDSCVEKQVE